MTLPSKTEVIVVGGGAMGTSCAYHLAQRGIEVVLLEWRNLASGATGRCGGMVVQLYGRSLNIEKTKERMALTRENHRILEEWQEELGDFEFGKQGCLDVAVDEEEWDLFERLVDIQRKLGDHEIELLDRKQTLEVMPSLPQHIIGSRYRPSDGNLNPFKLTHLLAREAKRYSASIFTQTRVEEILEKDGRIMGVRTKRGNIKAKWVVNATNAWASLLTKEVDIAPVREVAMVSEKVPALKSCPLEIRCGGEFAFGTTQTATGGVILGGPAPPPDKRNYYDEQVTLTEVMKCANYLRELMPLLGGISLIRCWVGTMAFTLDGIPDIGFVPGKEGLIIAAGFAAGMSQAAVVGRIIADLVTQGDTPFSMEVYDPKRFVGKKAEWPPHPWDLGTLHEFFEQRRGRRSLE